MDKKKNKLFTSKVYGQEIIILPNGISVSIEDYKLGKENYEGSPD